MVTKRQCGSHNKAWFSLAAQEQGQAKGSYGDVIAVVIIYKHQFLYSDWLRTCQLIPNQCNFISAEKWNWVQNGEIENDWQLGQNWARNKQNGGRKLDEDVNSISKF